MRARHLPMERLEKKRIKGHTYYYYSKWGRVNGKSRRLWQKYLGKPDDILRAVEGQGPRPHCAEVFRFGLAATLWQECQRANLIAHVDRHCAKREQGMSTGEYLALAALTRAIWKALITDVMAREALDLSSVCYDGTNFYTFIDTFNGRCHLAKRGK